VRLCGSGKGLLRKGNKLFECTRILGLALQQAGEEFHHQVLIVGQLLKAREVVDVYDHVISSVRHTSCRRQTTTHVMNSLYLKVQQLLLSSESRLDSGIVIERKKTISLTGCGTWLIWRGLQQVKIEQVQPQSPPQLLRQTLRSHKLIDWLDFILQ
jgi:hypothetical protein